MRAEFSDTLQIFVNTVVLINYQLVLQGITSYHFNNTLQLFWIQLPQSCKILDFKKYNKEKKPVGQLYFQI